VDPPRSWYGFPLHSSSDGCCLFARFLRISPSFQHTVASVDHLLFIALAGPDSFPTTLRRFRLGDVLGLSSVCSGLDTPSASLFLLRHFERASIRDALSFWTFNIAEAYAVLDSSFESPSSHPDPTGRSFSTCSYG